MSCVAPDGVKKTSEAPACAGPQVGAPNSQLKWSCPFCTAVRDGVVRLDQKNAKRQEAVAELSKMSRSFGVKYSDESTHITGAKLQRQICDLIEGTLVDLFNDCLTGVPPARHAMMVCGSLARREASAFSDIDAVLVLEDDDPGVIRYYTSVVSQMKLRLTFAGGYRTGFAFCPGGLHPLNLLGTPDRIFEYIDNNPADTHLRGAYHTRFIFGAKELGDDYVRLCAARAEGGRKASPKEALKLLQGIVNKKGTYWMEDEQEGWMPPPRDPVAVQVKCQFYRPVTMVIEALAIFYGAPGSSSRERVIALIESGHMSVEVGNFLFNIMDDTAKIRTAAHVKAGKEFEGVKLRATKATDFAGHGTANYRYTKADLDEMEVADRASIGIALALVERINRFWKMTETFVSEKSKRFAISRENPFKTKRP
jgi:signal-transduction protein with cAMP-binding, CBS, and nucleotidyltransferase domain